MSSLAIVIASLTALTLPFSGSAQTRSPSPASVDPSEVEFFLEDELGFGQSWIYDAMVDEFTDEVTHVATVQASEGEGFIHVQCDEDDRFATIVSTGLFLDTEEDWMDEKPVRYRVDKRSAVSDQWPGSGIRSLALGLTSLHFVMELMRGSRDVLVELTSRDGERQRARFSLQSAKSVLGRVLDACR